jgi:quinol monooxygenase YgiN
VFFEIRPSKQPEVLSTVRQVMRSIRLSPSCALCRFLADADDEHTMVLMSEWRTREALDTLLSSQEMFVLRGMRILLQSDLRLVIDEVAARRAVCLGDSSPG